MIILDMCGPIECDVASSNNALVRYTNWDVIRGHPGFRTLSLRAIIVLAFAEMNGYNEC